MARFYGIVGFGTSEDQGSGIFKDVIVEKNFYGDVISIAKNVNDPNKIISDQIITNSISIVADAYAYTNFLAIKYVSWMGTLWSVSSVQVERPRLILQVGGVYNGPTPEV